MPRELFTYPETPASDGWAMFNEPEIEITLDPATEALVDEIERDLREVIGSPPASWFLTRTAA